MVKLNEIFPDPYSVHNSKRVGRGPGSGKCKTCGSGHKGQKARSRVPLRMTGGQTPITRLLPKVGFRRLKNKLHTTITTDQIMHAIEAHKLDKNLTLAILIERRIIHKNIKLCKVILGKVEFDSEIKFGEGIKLSRSIC